MKKFPTLVMDDVTTTCHAILKLAKRELNINIFSLRSHSCLIFLQICPQ